MIRAPLSITSVLDESADVVAVAAPWTAVLVLTSLPYRLAQILFVDRLFEAGSEAIRYGNVLGCTANLAIAAFVLSLLPRSRTPAGRTGVLGFRLPLSSRRLHDCG